MNPNIKKVILDLTGRGGLAPKWGGDIVLSGYAGYTQTGQPNLRYTGGDSQMAAGVYDPIAKYGYLSPAPNTIFEMTNSAAIAANPTVTLADDQNQTLYFFNNAKIFSSSYTGGAYAAALTFGTSATAYTDATIYYLNGVRTGFIAARTSSAAIVKTFPLTGSISCNEDWSSTDVSGAFALTQSYATTFINSGDGYLYLLNANAVHRIDGTTFGGAQGTITKNVLLAPTDVNLTHGIEYKNSIYIVVQDGYEQNWRWSTAGKGLTQTTSRRDMVGVYIWNRQSTIFNSSNFINLPGLSFVKNIWVSPKNDLFVMGVTVTNEVQILKLNGSSFVPVETLPPGASTNLNHALKIYGNFVYWCADDGNIYRYGSEYANETDFLTIVGVYNTAGVENVNPVCISTFTAQTSSNIVPSISKRYPDHLHIIGEYDSSTYKAKDFLLFPYEYYVEAYNSFLPIKHTIEPHQGNIYTPVKQLPTLSTLKHINFVHAPYNSVHTIFDGVGSFVTYAAGKFSDCIVFNGTTSKAIFEDLPQFRVTSNFSVSFLLNAATPAALSGLFWNGARLTNYSGIQIALTSGGKILFRSAKNTGTVSGTDYKDCTSATTVSDSTWRHVTCTWDGSNMKIYVDGTLDATVAWVNAPVYQTINYVRMGYDQDDAVGGHDFYAGKLDDFSFFGRLLTAGEITTLAGALPLSGTSLNFDANLVLYLSMDDDLVNRSYDTTLQREASIKFYANQSSTPFMTKYVTRADIAKGYTSFEINKPFVNSIQLETEYYNSANLNNNSLWSPLGVSDFSPAYAELTYEVTNTLK